MDHRMPWGKYRGKALWELPAGYIDWLMTNCDLLQRNEGLFFLLGREMLRRYQRFAPAPAPPGITREQVSQVRKVLALQYHPDRGGNLEAMKAINSFYDALMAVCPS